MEQPSKLAFKEYWDLLVKYLRPQKGRVLLLTILTVGNIALQLVNPQIVRFFLDSAETGSGLEQLLGAAGLFMGVALVNQLVKIWATYVGENVAWTASNDLRADLALHCLKLDMSFHKQYKPGELIERVDGDVNQLANFFSQLVVRLGSNLLLILGVLALLTLLDWRLGAWIGLVALIGLVCLDQLNKRIIPRWQAVREVEARLFGFIEEWLNGAEEIRTNAAQPYILLRLYQALRARWQKVLAAMRLEVLVSDLPLGVFALAYSVAHILGAATFTAGRLSTGQVYLIFYYIDILKGPLWEILRQVQDLQRAVASINRVIELNQVESRLKEGPGARLPVGPLGLHFEKVSFHYEDDTETDVLKGLSFILQPGRILGLLGRTGSGKSTLTKLIFRFYDPTDGVIHLAGQSQSESAPISNLDISLARLSELRRRIGMVTQEVQLFQASVRHNLTLFNDSIPDFLVLEAIEEIGLVEWLQTLPNGLDTRLEAGGSGLSAGEAQLLAFARVLLADPGLVILDEASSRLDKVTEQRIEKAITRLLTDRTGIIVAHRLSTVQRADEIMILDDGCIAEHGRRTDLAHDPNSLFFNLLQTGLEEALA